MAFLDSHFLKSSRYGEISSEVIIDIVPVYFHAVLDAVSLFKRDGFARLIAPLRFSFRLPANFGIENGVIHTGLNIERILFAAGGKERRIHAV